MTIFHLLRNEREGEMNRQCKMVLDWNKTHKGITSAEAWFNLGISSLSRRICDLQELGYTVKKVKEHRLNHHTLEEVPVVRYYVSQTTLEGLL